MQVTVKLDHSATQEVIEMTKEALVDTADFIFADLKQSETMPFDTGALQNRSTYIDDKKKAKGIVRIVSDTPYARRLYYHPEYHFQKTKNSHAGGLWFEPYISGKKKNLINDTFKKLMKGKI